MNRAIFGKLTVTLSRNALTFMEPEGSLPCSQYPATGPTLNQTHPLHHPPTLFP